MPAAGRLKDAINEAMRDWVTNVTDTYYLLGSVLGPHPYPLMVREFQSVIGREARAQILRDDRPASRRRRRVRRRRQQCDSASSTRSSQTRRCGCWRGGRRRSAGAGPARRAICRRAARACCRARARTCCRTPNGNIELTHSISAGLDYAAVGPEHAWLRDLGRAEYTWIGDAEALAAFQQSGPDGGDHSRARIGARDRVRMHAGAGARARERAAAGQPVGPRRQGRPERATKYVLGFSPAFDRIRAEKRTGLVTYVTAGDPDLARSARDPSGARPRGRGRAGGGDPVLRAAGRRPRHSAGHGAGAGGRRNGVEACSIWSGRVAPSDQSADRAVQLRQPDTEDGHRGVRRSRAERPASTACWCWICRSKRPEQFRDAMAARDIDMIFLLSPTTTDARIQAGGEAGPRFLYGISRLGVTGTRDTVADGAEALAGRIRSATSLPLALGFGISRPEHVRQIGRWADAAVVGSGLVGVIAEAGKSPDLVDRVESYVRWLR